MPTRPLVITESDFDRLSGLVKTPQAHAGYEPLSALPERLAVGQVVPGERMPGSVVTMNSTVRIRDIKRRVRETYTLSYPSQADISQGRVSVLAPLGRALLGAKVGDVVSVLTPDGIRRIRIDGILYQPESAGDLHL